MKRLISLFLFGVMAVSGACAQNTYVLLVGVSRYSDQKANLNSTTKDVKDIKTVFDNQPNTIVSIVTSKYANHDNIVKKLNAIIQLAKPEDKIMFFFSGHGGDGGFLTYEMRIFPYQELVAILSKAKTKQVFCFVDACHSGSASHVATGGSSWASEAKNITFMMGCRADEFSLENDWVGHGYFTKALLKGLRGMSDKNNDRKVTVKELFDYIYNDVTARTKKSRYVQHPQLIGPGSAYNTVLTKW